MIGCVRMSDGKIVSKSQPILVFQGNNLLLVSKSLSNGKFDIGFNAGVSTRRPVDIYTISYGDTLLLASLVGFENEDKNHGDLFIPKPLNTKVNTCPKCGQADKLFSLIYDITKQKDYDRHTAPIYCSRDKTKF